MAPSLLDTFRVLASFSPGRTSLRGAPWEEYVDWAIGQGLAPLAAYNLEYRLGGGNAPEWVRDRLLSIYQGSVNDNVMKLVNFKRAVDELEGRRIVLLGGASYAESLYPHVAFRPVLDLDLLLPASDLDGLAGTGYLQGAGLGAAYDLGVGAERAGDLAVGAARHVEDEGAAKHHALVHQLGEGLGVLHQTRVK